MEPPSKKPRGLWSLQQLEAAMAAVQGGVMSQRATATRYSIPRITLVNHLKSDKVEKQLGRRTVLTATQENDLAARIKRLASIGFPLTPKVIRPQVYVLCEQHKIQNNFNQTTKRAGEDWLQLFLKRDPDIGVTNIFLVNLSVADLLVTLFCMPVQIAKAVTLIWYFGDVMCKTVNFLQGVAVASSVFTITAMSVDRYLAITQSLRQPWMPSRRGACGLLVTLWLVALAIFSPLLSVAAVETEIIPLLTKTKNGTVLVEHAIDFCTEKWPTSIRKEMFGAFSFILVYAVPGCIVVVSYSLMGRRLCSVLPPFDQTEGSVNSQQRLRLVRERKRVALILLLLAILFALCWLPYNTLQLLVDVNAVRVESVALALPYTLLLGHTNSAINPIVYCLMTRNFRRSLRKLLCHDPGNIQSSTHFHMQGLRQKSNTSSMKTRTTVTFRSSNNHLGRSCTPAIQYGRVPRGGSLIENGYKDAQGRAAHFL